MAIKAVAVVVEHSVRKADRAFSLAASINAALQGGTYVGHIAVSETQRAETISQHNSGTIANPIPVDPTEGVVLLIDVHEIAETTGA